MEEPQNPPASGGTRTFGIHKYNPEYCLGSETQRENRRRGYEAKYEDDALGEELGDEARIWRVMLDEGRASDAAMLQRFRDHLDVDLVFAGLFSAVLTTFVAQTSQLPSNAGDNTVALLLELIAIQRAWADNNRVDGVSSYSLLPPAPSPSPWINRCWFLSLIFSLLAAFGAVVVRQWLQEYESDITGPPKRRALVRHYRRVGLEKYKVHLIVPILPMLLHVSLLLFFVGLTLYVRESDRSMANGIIALTVMIYLVYLGTNLMPVFLPQCPFRSPLSMGARWVKSLVVLLYALLPTRLRMKALLPFLLQNLTSAASYVHAPLVRVCGRLPPHLQSAFSTCAKTVKRRLQRTQATLRDQLKSLGEALEKCWKEVFKATDAYEWEAVLSSSSTTVPDSFDLMAQSSSNLSVTPLVVQATSSLPIDHVHYGDYNFEDLRYTELLRHRVLPWFIGALSTWRTAFKWEPGRENELQRMACVLLLVPLDSTDAVLWDEIDTAQYRACVSGVLQALTSALLDLPHAPASTMTDVSSISMTLLALGSRLDDVHWGSKLLQNGALIDIIATAYSSLPQLPSLTILRLRPVIWHHALTYLRYHGRPIDDTAHLVFTLWHSAYSEAPFPDNDNRQKERLATLPRVTLQEWLYLRPNFSEDATIAIYRLLCPQSCESHESLSFARGLSHASRLHMVCHAVDLCIEGDSADWIAAFDDKTLAMQFVETLLATLGYESIDSALRITGHLAVSAAFRSTFLFGPKLSFARSVKADAPLPATFAVSLFWFLAKLTQVTYLWEEKLAIFSVLDRHAANYCKVLPEALECDEISIELLRHLVLMVLHNPKLAVLDVSDAIAASLATQLSNATASGSVPSDQPADGMLWCIYLDALCVARAHSKRINMKFPDASRKLHSALLSLKPTYHDAWKNQVTMQLRHEAIPLAVALALKSMHGREALAEWVDDLPTLVQDPSSGLRVWVPDEAVKGIDRDWYRHFTSNPDKYVRATPQNRRLWLHISELVTFEEAVERMRSSDAERAAVEEWRSPRSDGVEAGTNDDAANAACERDRRDQGGAENTQNQTTARGVWMARALESVCLFLARISGLRQVGGRDRPSSIALADIDVDVERDAGTSVAPKPERSAGRPPAPARASEGWQDNGAGQAAAERSEGAVRKTG